MTLEQAAQVATVLGCVQDLEVQQAKRKLTVLEQHILQQLKHVLIYGK